MLSQPGFEDRSLAESLYRVLFDRFYDSFDSATRTLFSSCTFGIAPSQAGVKTFFIVATNQAIAEQLEEQIDTIINRVAMLMPGVQQTAICFIPPGTEVDTQPQNHKQFPCKFMVGKFFPHPTEAETLAAE